MLAALAAAVVVPVVPEAQLPVPAPLQEERELPARARPLKLPLLASWQVVVVRLALPVLVALVAAQPAVAPVVLLHLLSRQSFSAAMARSSP